MLALRRPDAKSAPAVASWALRDTDMLGHFSASHRERPVPFRVKGGSYELMTVETRPAVDRDRANEVVQRFQSESTKWLYGLDDAARILSWAFFTLLPYTDKLSQGKKLRQPHIMFRGPTGTGKTDLVSACAMAIDAKFERIQGTADLHAGGHPRLRDDRRGGRRQPQDPLQAGQADGPHRPHRRGQPAVGQDQGGGARGDGGELGDPQLRLRQPVRGEDAAALPAVVRLRRHQTGPASSW